MGHVTSQGVQVHKYADTGAEVSGSGDWNGGKGTDGGEEQGKEEEEQRQEEEEQRKEEEEQRQEEEEQRQEEEEQRKDDEDDIEVKVEKDNGSLTRGKMDMKVELLYTVQNDITCKIPFAMLK